MNIGSEYFLQQSDSMKRLVGFITLFCLMTTLSATGLTIIKADSIMDSRFIGKWVCKLQAFKNKEGVVTRQVSVDNLVRKISPSARVLDCFQIGERTIDFFYGKITMRTDSTLTVVADNGKAHPIYPKVSNFTFRFSKDQSFLKLKMKVPSGTLDQAMYYEEIWERLVDKPREDTPRYEEQIRVALR